MRLYGVELIRRRQGCRRLPGWPIHFVDKLAECGVRSWHVLCLVSHGVALPLARPTLRAALAEQNVSPAERKLLDNVVKRVRMWNDVAPFYPSKATDAPRQRNRGARSRF
jgi:hypothetical protein